MLCVVVVDNPIIFKNNRLLKSNRLIGGSIMIFEDRASHFENVVVRDEQEVAMAIERGIISRFSLDTRSLLDR